MSTIVIVGTGVAGVSAAHTLRNEGFTGRIVLVGDEQAKPYRRPVLSKDLLANSISREKALLKPAAFWSDNNIELWTGVRVVDLDTDLQQLRLNNGEVLPYDAVLLATGARARQLHQPIDPHAFTLRSMDDVEPLRASLAQTGSLLVIGGGLIGCEVAATARGLGVQVTVLENTRAPLSRVVSPAVSDMIVAMHAEHGVQIHTEVSIATMERLDEGTARATAADGRQWHAGTVLVAVGSVPNTELAAAAGLHVDNGIVVDEEFRTSAPGVFAAGDAANIPGPAVGQRCRSEQWNAAQAQGAAAARSMLGQPMAVADTPWGWSNQYGHNLQFAGSTRHDDDYTIDGAIGERDFTASAVRDGRLVGVIALGRPREFTRLRTLIGDAH